MKVSATHTTFTCSGCGVEVMLFGRYLDWAPVQESYARCGLTVPLPTCGQCVIDAIRFKGTGGIPRRHFSPHTGTPEFQRHEFPPLADGEAWELETDTWTDDGVWWRRRRKQSHSIG